MPSFFEAGRESHATLAKVGRHTRAAGLLHVTQSAVSHGIKRLETQLGCGLFYKKGRTAHLTPEGRMFYTRVLRILEPVVLMVGRGC